MQKFKESMDTKKKVAELKEKDKQKHHKLLMKKREDNRSERLSKITKAGSAYKVKGQVISTLEIQNANSLLMRNQYQNSDMIPLYYKEQIENV